VRAVPTPRVCEAPKEYAKRLCRDQTIGERKLWLLMRDRRLGGATFRRQHPIGPFVVERE